MIVEHTRLRPFQTSDLAPLVDFWNCAFAGQRNFSPLSTHEFQSRVLDCEAFDPNGLILAWHENQTGSRLVGLVHAFRPAPKRGLYLRWERRHDLALLYVDPAYRRQGIGTRLLRAAENWLYYCPVHVGGPAQPCYGTVEGLRPPFFGSTQRMGISIHEQTLIRFLANRGYHIVEPGDVSMTLKLGDRDFAPPTLPDLDALGLHLMTVSHEQPFQGREPAGREEYTLYGDNGGAPYLAYLFVTSDGLLQGHISLYPMRQPGHVAIGGFWVAPSLRGHGLGNYLLDRTLYDLVHAAASIADYDAVPAPPNLVTLPQWGKCSKVEVQTHLVKHAQATVLYEQRGFEVDAAWVNLSKECAVRGATPV